MPFRIITDSTTDLSPALYAQHQITVLPLHFRIGGQEYPDGWSDMDPASFYGRLRRGEKSTTSAVNLGQFIDAFTPPLEAGEDLLFLGFSSLLSSTAATAALAAEELRNRYPQRQILVIDTRCASAGEGLLVLLAARRRDQGESLEAVADWVRTTAAPCIQHWFTVDSLGHLHRGGRLSAASALVGCALSIKPILTVSPEGALIPVGRARGRRASLLALVDRMAENGFDPGHCPDVIVSHADATKDAALLAETVKRRYPAAAVTVLPLGAVIGSHAGPGTASVFFLGSRR